MMKTNIAYVFAILSCTAALTSPALAASSTDGLVDGGNSSSVQLGSAPKAAGQCVIKDEWLNTTDYDQHIDYQNKGIQTDFFMLVYSNAPRFCDFLASQGRVDEAPFQCQSPNNFGWVIHGLWGENKTAYIAGKNNGHPRFCKGDLPLVPVEKMKPYLCMSPSTSLLQGEWEKHGACDFNTASDYYAQTQALYMRYKTPPAKLSTRDAVRWMKQHNPELQGKWLNLTKHEFGICFTTTFEVMSCPKKDS